MSSSMLIINLAVLFAILEADIGRRKIGWFRILRPLLMAGAVVPMFLEPLATSGHGALFEMTLAASGVVLGLLASTMLMRVHFDAAKQRGVSSAGVAYALFWTAVIGCGWRSPMGRTTGSRSSSGSGWPQTGSPLAPSPTG